MLPRFQCRHLTGDFLKNTFLKIFSLLDTMQSLTSAKNSSSGLDIPSKEFLPCLYQQPRISVSPQSMTYQAEIFLVQIHGDHTCIFQTIFGSQVHRHYGPLWSFEHSSQPSCFQCQFQPTTVWMMVTCKNDSTSSKYNHIL